MRCRFQSPLKICLITILLLLCMVSCAYADAGSSKLYMDITFEGNLVFDTYDVNLYLDGAHITSIAHGQPCTVMTSATNGKHTILFTDVENEEVRGSTEIQVNGDSTFSCTIEAKRKEIKISKVKVEDGLIGAALSVPNEKYEILSDAVKELEKAGFINVSEKAEDGSQIIDKGNWIIVSQSVDAGQAIDKNDSIVLTCRKNEDFVKEQFGSLTAYDAGLLAYDLKYDVSYINSISGKQMPSDFRMESDQELKSWLVSGTSASKKTVKLSLVYTGKVIMPDVKEMVLSEAKQMLRELNCSNITDESSDGSIWNESNWRIIMQSPQPGESIAANEEITLTCEKIDKKSESAGKTSSTDTASSSDSGGAENSSAIVPELVLSATTSTPSPAATTPTPAASPQPTETPKTVPDCVLEPVYELNFSMIDENDYQGEWVEISDGYEIYLPQEWTKEEVTSENMLLEFTDKTTEFGLEVKYLKPETMKSNHISTAAELGAFLYRAGFSDAEQYLTNSIPVIAYTDVEQDQYIIAFLDTNGGMYELRFYPQSNEKYLYYMADILLSIRIHEG